MKMNQSHLKRAARIVAFGIASGIVFMGAGNMLGFAAVESAAFGATGSLLGLAASLLFIYAAQGDVRDDDFDTTINAAIEKVRSKESDGRNK
jgi:hypothetical protein